MFKQERHYLILKALEQNRRIQGNEIMKLLNVSIDTVRRDIDDLAAKKLLIKVRGGALPVSFVKELYEASDDSRLF